MAITALPTAPQRSDAPDVFVDKADAWVAAIDLWTTQANDLQTDVNAKQLLAAASETAAELAKNNAETAQAASEAARDLSIANASGTVAAGSAKDWASKAEDSQVITGQYSALHWAAKAAASVAVLPAGTINDSLTALDKTWSSSKITNEILDGRLIEQESKTEAYTVLIADRAKLINCSGSFTLNFDDATNLGSGWYCYVRNTGSSNITIDPYSSQTIDSLTTGIIEAGDTYMILCDGSNLSSIKISPERPHYITSTKMWTCPIGIYSITVELWGGGGSGYKNSSTTQAAGGGQGGSYSKKTIAVTPGSTKAITIGSGGASQTTAGSVGNEGGTSSFSIDITCPGGNGGGLVVSGSGSASTGGDINIIGSQGIWLGELKSFGGNSAGSCPAVGNASKVDGIYPGGGGTGVSSSYNSGAGANGLCIIWY